MGDVRDAPDTAVERLYAGLIRGGLRYLAPTVDVRVRVRIVDGGVGRVRFIEAGSGDPLILVHGFGSNSLEWLPQLVDLATSHRVIALDLPGHGGSTRSAEMTPAALLAAIDDLCDAVGIERAAFAGHSLGGGVALELAKRRPTLVRALILVGAAGFSSNAVTRSFPDLTSLVPSTARACLAMVRGSAPGLTGDEQRGAAASWWLCRRAEANDGPLHRWLDTVASGKAFRIERLEEVLAPTLVVWGDRDTVSPLDRGIALADGIAGADRIIYPEVGHFPHLERRPAFTAAVRGFLTP